MNNLKPPGRDERILRALLIERRKQVDIAKAEGISRARLGQILDRLGIHTRPVQVIDNPDKIRALVPEWQAEQVDGAIGSEGDEQ